MSMFSLLITLCISNYCEQTVDARNSSIDDCNILLIQEVMTNKITTDFYNEILQSSKHSSIEPISTKLECIAIDLE